MYNVPIPAIDAAVRAVLLASPALTALLATKPPSKGGGPAIYAHGDVKQGDGTLYPYLLIGAYTQVRDHRMSPGAGGYGWNCTLQVTAVGQKSEAQLFTITNEVFAVLPDGGRLDVAGYGSAWADEFTVVPTLMELHSGVTTYRVPAVLRVRVHT